METMKIIGITGRARSGKDTMAEMIVAMSRSGIRMSFADPIRQFVARLTGITLQEITDSPIKEIPIPQLGGKSPRQMMQTLGTEWGRDLVDQDLWIKIARRDVDELVRLGESKPDVIVFSDVRFENEAAMIREIGGSIIHIERPGVAAVNHHASETALHRSSEDWRFVNIASLDEMEKFLTERAASGWKQA